MLLSVSNWPRAQKDNPGVPDLGAAHRRWPPVKPRWSADLSIDGMPASHLLAIARHMGAPIPREVEVKGNIVGIAGYGPAAGLQGQLLIDGATVKLGNGPELTVERAGLLLAGEELRLRPASASGGGRSAELEVIFSPTRQRFDDHSRPRFADCLACFGRSHRDGSQSAVSAFLGRHLVGLGPLHERSLECWKMDREPGHSRHHDASARHLVPVRLASASVDLDGADVTLKRMRLASTTWRFRAITATPQKAIVICSASSHPPLPAGHRAHDDADAERSGLLARMQLTRAAVPAWLRERNAGESYASGAWPRRCYGSRLSSAARLVGPSGAIVRDRQAVEEGRLTGDASLDLAKVEPGLRSTPT